jgi:hypothetical protein
MILEDDQRPVLRDRPFDSGLPGAKPILAPTHVKSRAAFQSLLGLGTQHPPVRRRTIVGASDLPYYYEGDEIEGDEAEDAEDAEDATA